MNFIEGMRMAFFGGLVLSVLVLGICCGVALTLFLQRLAEKKAG